MSTGLVPVIVLAILVFTVALVWVTLEMIRLVHWGASYLKSRHQAQWKRT